MSHHLCLLRVSKPTTREQQKQKYLSTLAGGNVLGLFISLHEQFPVTVTLPSVATRQLMKPKIIVSVAVHVWSCLVNMYNSFFLLRIQTVSMWLMDQLIKCVSCWNCQESEKIWHLDARCHPQLWQLSSHVVLKFAHCRARENRKTNVRMTSDACVKFSAEELQQQWMWIQFHFICAADSLLVLMSQNTRTIFHWQLNSLILNISTDRCSCI